MSSLFCLSRKKIMSIVSEHETILSTRLTNVEQDVGDIREELASLNADTTYIKTSVARLLEGGKTNWGLLATFASVIITIVVYHNSLVLEPINQYVSTDNARHVELKEAGRINDLRWQDIERVYADRISALQSKVVALEATAEVKHGFIVQQLAQIQANIDLLNRTRYSKDESSQDKELMQQQLMSISERLSKLESL